ncbi:MAG: ExbD/TolR family protein [Luteibaculaceae bacterium]
MNQVNIDPIPQSKRKSASMLGKIIDIDMNPMVDLAFLLLTFFMLTTTLNNPNAIDIVIPAKPKDTLEEKQQPVKESLTISVIITSDNNWFWYRGVSKPVPVDISKQKNNVENIFAEFKANVPELILLIKPHLESDYADLVMLLDAVKNSNLERYAIVAYSDFDDELAKNIPF